MITHFIFNLLLSTLSNELIVHLIVHGIRDFAVLELQRSQFQGSNPVLSFLANQVGQMFLDPSLAPAQVGGRSSIIADAFVESGDRRADIREVEAWSPCLSKDVVMIGTVSATVFPFRGSFLDCTETGIRAGLYTRTALASASASFKFFISKAAGHQIRSFLT